MFGNTFTHIELFRLKQAQDVLNQALKYNHPVEMENDLVSALKALQTLIDSVKVKQDTMKKNVL